MAKTSYIIKTGGLPTGIHEFEFDVKGSFFKEFETEQVSEAEIQIKAQVQKQNNVLQVSVNLSGTITTSCDRCLKEYPFPVSAQEILLIKPGNPEDSNDEVLFVEEGETDFDVTSQIYEYALTSIPIRKVPCETDAAFECDEDVVSKLEELETRIQSERNPEWEKLNKLKNKN